MTSVKTHHLRITQGMKTSAVICSYAIQQVKTKKIQINHIVHCKTILGDNVLKSRPDRLQKTPVISHRLDISNNFIQLYLSPKQETDSGYDDSLQSQDI